MPVSVNNSENGGHPGDPDFEEIEIAEEELIDAYVRGQLSGDERKLLEKGLRNSPHLVDRLHFARLLADAADRATEAEVSSNRQHQESSSSRKPWWHFLLTWRPPQPALNLAFATSVLIIVVGGPVLMVGWMSLRRESQQLAEQKAALERQKSELQKSAAEQQLATDQIRAQLREEQQKREADQQLIAELQQAQNKETTGSSTIASLFLLPASRASGKEKELKPPSGTSKIRLQLAVESIDYSSFMVQVKNSQDREIFQSRVRRPRSGKLVTITIPSSVLPASAYTLQLSGITPEGTSELVGNYSFRIAPASQ